METLKDRIRHNIEAARDAIERAAQSVGRRGSEVRMVIVTKTHPPEVVEAVIHAGGRILGENYPEETLPKMMALSSYQGVEWHMIGHVQSRKSAIVAEHFDMIESLDSLRLAERLDRQVAELRGGARLPALLEFNVGGEESKHGWRADDENAWEGLLPEMERLMQLRHLSIEGLMTMPPLYDDPEASRPYFVRLRKLQDFLQKRFPQAHLTELSMGTSADYPAAVQEGATLVRIGRAILGPRLNR